MGGRIWVESEPGKGSTFHFTANLRSSGRDNHNPVQRNLRNLRVLVADRGFTGRLIVKEILGQYGATIVEAATVQELTEALAWATSASRAFDVVFADCQMLGVERLARLAKTEGESGARLLVPMITTDGLRNKLENLRQLGIYAYVRKPVGRCDLLEVASRAVAALRGDNAEVSVKIREHGRVAPPPNLPQTFSAEAPKFRLLVADDSPDNRLVISAFLKRLPFEIEVAENGRVAVDKFACGHYDLVLMDIQMPVLDGHTAVRLMRKFESERHLQATPILALTASTLEDDVRKAIEAGCNAHVAKPIRKEALLTALAATLEGATIQAPQNPAVQPHC